MAQLYLTVIGHEPIEGPALTRFPGQQRPRIREFFSDDRSVRAEVSRPAEDMDVPLVERTSIGRRGYYPSTLAGGEGGEAS
jgi:hypothetical protein